MPPRVLDVGQCGFDHSAIADLLEKLSGAQVDNADSAEEAQELVEQNKYHLILINRILDADGSSGIELIRKLRNRPGCPPVMLVSNHPDAQLQAIAAGAVEGFGKAAIHLPQTAEHLEQVLGIKKKSSH
jgi:CheY-like chemotaxis protein